MMTFKRFIEIHVKLTAQLVNYKCKNIIKLTLVYLNSKILAFLPINL